MLGKNPAYPIAKPTYYVPVFTIELMIIIITKSMVFTNFDMKYIILKNCDFYH